MGGRLLGTLALDRFGRLLGCIPKSFQVFLFTATHHVYATQTDGSGDAPGLTQADVSRREVRQPEGSVVKPELLAGNSWPLSRADLVMWCTPATDLGALCLLLRFCTALSALPIYERVDDMSVTFHKSLCDEDCRGFAVECLECETTEVFSTHTEAAQRFETFRAEHGDYTLCSPQWVPHTTVNVANSNAAYLLELLGIDACELWGECVAEEFAGRIEQATAQIQAGTLPVSGLEYATQSLGRLADVAAEAVAAGRTVVWS
jgi:hypothetical protein